jgi:hypothetical protein
LRIRRHFISQTLLGRGGLRCYCALLCPDSRLAGDWPRPPKPLHSSDFFATVSAIGWERYWAAVRPIINLRLLNKQ